MWPVSAAWLAMLGGPHGRSTRAEAWYDGAFVADVPVSGGWVDVTARNRQRRTLTALVPESMWPKLPTDALSVDGGQIKVWQGITDTRGNLVDDEVPVFVGRVEDLDRERFAGQVTVTGLDPAAAVNDAQFQVPRPALAGSSITANIIGLITEVQADAQVVDLTGSAAPLPQFVMWDQDRGQAADDLAASLGAEVFCLPDGVTWHIRPIPTLTDAPVWTVKEGQGGVLVRDVMGRSRTDVPNVLVVHVEQAGTTPLLVVLTDDDATSPTRVGGPFGTVVRHYSNSLITTLAQGQAAGRARLANSQGITRTRSLDVVPNPALEAGDVIPVVTAEGTELHIADSFRLPLSTVDIMTITTRSTLVS